MRVVKSPDGRLLASGALASVVSVGFLITTPACRHWFMVPVWACGLIMGIELLAWLADDLDLFDVRGVIGALGFHFFFLAPQLHVAMNVWAKYVDPPADWRLALGVAASLNAPSLVLYRVVAQRAFAVGRRAHAPRVFSPASGWMLWLACAFSAACLAVLLGRFGGIAGLIDAYDGRLSNPDVFTGTGWLFGLSESLLLLLFVVAVCHLRKRPEIPGWGSLLLVLALFAALRFVTAGLRGSRSNTVYAIFWAVGVVHLWLRPIPRRMLPIALAALVVFMYAYGVYKYGGLAGVGELRHEGISTVVDSSLLPSAGEVLLGDLGRADIQATLVSRHVESGGDAYMAFGRTYVGALALLIPRSVLKERPPTKIEEGTLLTLGWRASEGPYPATYLYGIAGEAILNVGLIGVPLAYLVFGVVVGLVAARQATWRRPDPRLFLTPLLVVAAVQLLVADSDVVLFFVVTWIVPLAATLWLASLRLPGARRPQRRPGRTALAPLAPRRPATPAPGAIP